MAEEKENKNDISRAYVIREKGVSSEKNDIKEALMNFVETHSYKIKKRDAWRISIEYWKNKSADNAITASDLYFRLFEKYSDKPDYLRKSYEYLQLAQDQSEKKNDTIKLEEIEKKRHKIFDIIQNNRINVLVRIGSIDKHVLKMAELNYKHAQTREEKVKASSNISEIYLKLGKLEKAKEYYSISINNSGNDPALLESLIIFSNYLSDKINSKVDFQAYKMMNLKRKLVLPDIKQSKLLKRKENYNDVFVKRISSQYSSLFGKKLNGINIENNNVYFSKINLGERQEKWIKGVLNSLKKNNILDYMENGQCKYKVSIDESKYLNYVKSIGKRK
jgi:hypothetical protein